MIPNGRCLSEMTQEVTGWLLPILPERDAFNTLIKIQEELSEALHALHTGEGRIEEELADIFVLLLDAAYLTNTDLQKEFEAKMNVNRQREWKPSLGTMKHVKG